MNKNEYESSSKYKKKLTLVHRVDNTNQLRPVLHGHQREQDLC